jgi:DNA-binding response OmpR family regulator
MGFAKHILIVDDEPNVRLVFRTTLESTGAELAAAEDGEAALAWLKDHSVDLVLLDLQMPRLGGMGVLERLRAAGNNVPVIIVTAHGSIPDAVAAMKLGAIDFLSKPLTPDALRRAVAEVLDRESPRPSPSPSPVSRPTGDVIPFLSPFASHLRDAKQAINRRHFGDAEVHLHQAINLNPRSAEAHNLMGVLHESQGEHDASYRSYRAALKADREYEPARHNMQRHYERFTFGRSNLPVDTGED